MFRRDFGGINYGYTHEALNTFYGLNQTYVVKGSILAQIIRFSFW
jgi:hypothetical protein